MKIINALSCWRFIAIILLAMSLSVTAFATGEPVVRGNRLNGSLGQIKADSVVTVIDSSLIGTTYTSENKVSFGIDESSVFVIQGAFNASVKLQIKATMSNNSIVQYDTVLRINYDGTGSYVREHAFYTKGAYKIEAKVIEIATNAVWNVWNLLKVYAEVSSNIQYEFSCSLNAVDNIDPETLSSNTDRDELLVSWPNKIGTDEYDLEWTYIDSSALASGEFGLPASQQLIFKNNATRVSVAATSYPIPLIYDSKGHLFFRVRSVHITSTGQRVESEWSNSSTAMGRFDYDGHERKLNWQATTTFAEEGKRKTVVQYFDGSLRNRQTVTKDNSGDSTTIVAETFYDLQGRPVIQVLPSPTLENIIKYNHNFNTGAAGSEYTTDMYDVLGDNAPYCGYAADSMSTSSGASRYFSPENPEKNSGIHRFIPDARKYPYTETQYTQDNTGRINKQGGVGPVHKIGSNHETVYYYGTPSQEELDGLFGTEVGHYSHYQKTMVKDANGQFSVSYLDMRGKTIATAFAGVPSEAALDTLNSYTQETITETITDSSSAVIKDLVIESKKGLIVPRTAYHTFNYELSPQSIELESCDSSVCYDCLYDLRIAISGSCNNEAFGGQPFDTVIANFNINGIIDGVCNNSGFSFSFTKLLTEGSYEITKQLSVSRYGIDYYRDSIFYPANSCSSFEDFVNEQRTLLDSTLSCTAICDSCETTEYDDIRAAMLSDMSAPSGQYANIDSTSDTYSVFYEGSGGPKYKLVTNYVDEEGNPDVVYDDSTDTYVNPSKLSPQQFAERFKPSWANALLVYHPEYCKLLEYESSFIPSAEWAKRFEEVDTYAEAIAKGYLNPSGETVNGAFTPYITWTGTHPDVDPLAGVTGFTDSVENKMATYHNSPSGAISIWQMALGMLTCGPGSAGACYSQLSPFNSGYCDGDNDMAWRNFRQMYLSLRKNLMDVFLAKNSCNGSNLVPLLLSKHHQPHFALATTLLAENGITVPGADNTQADAFKAARQVDMEESFTIACEAYIPQWKKDLGNCYDETTLNAIIAKMVEVCKNGADESHPFGSSTIAPGSTYQYNSFQDVLDDYSGIDATCTADRITSPRPYNNQVIYSNKPVWTKPEDCECEKINSIYTQYQADSAQYSGFSDFMQKKFQAEFPDSTFNVLKNLCAGNNMGCNYLSSPIILPPVLQCYSGEVCINCEKMDSLFSEFKQKYPGIIPVNAPNDSLQKRNNRLFENYFNNVLGFGKPTTEYLSFLNSCGIQGPQLFLRDTLNNWLDDFKKHGGVPQLDAGGCDTSHWKLNYGNSVSHVVPVKIGDVFRNGYASVPDSVQHLPNTNRIDHDFYQDICLDSAGFTFETRLKIPDSVVIPNAWSSYLWIWLTNKFNTGPGTLLTSYNFGSLSNSLGFCTNGGGDDPANDCVAYPILIAPDFNDFRVIKYKIRNRNCKIYLDDTLLLEKTLPSPFVRMTNFSVSVFSKKAIIDYVKIYDTAGNYLYNEEFDGCNSIQLIKSNCAENNCITDFENYFNDRAGTTYGFSSIDSIYNAVTHRPLNICKNGESCDTLRQLIWDYHQEKLGYRENGCDSSKWAVNYGFSFNPITSFSNTISNGVAHLPYDSTLSNGRTAFDYRDPSLCPGDKFSVEIRVKNPNPAGLDALHWGFIYRESPLKNISVALYKPNPNPSGGYFYIDGGTQVYGPNLGQDISDWRRIKISKDGPVYTVYMDDTLAASVTTTHGGTVSLPRISMLFNGRDGYVDWVKIYDSTNTIRYFEDFEDCNNFSKPAPQITCSGKDCISSFVDYFNSNRQTSLTASEIDSVYLSCGIRLNVCDTLVRDYSNLLLCGNSLPVAPPVDINAITNCSDSTFFIYSVATELHRVYTDSLKGSFDDKYRARCLNAYKMETFTVSHEVSEYHYTLYYYDQAGNLVKTIPPKGVSPNRNSTWLEEIKNKRALKEFEVPGHSLATDYRYNTLNQVVAQRTPDAGLSEFWYDRLGRLALSRNARQKAASETNVDTLYSYTTYDVLGRINEVGQVKDNPGGVVVDDALTRHPENLETWLSSRSSFKEQVTRTIYDLPYTAFETTDIRLIVQQRNLRNRVSYTTFTETSAPSAFNQATFYTYDIHGNVDTLLQDYGVTSQFPNLMNENGNRYKKIIYNYDLISGKVNKVAYQPGWSDQVFHKYTYDAENRITNVETSFDGKNWECDARYKYYRHGPLARMQLGHQKVQGIDYAYTLQGWLKGVNSTLLTPENDMGGDGLTGDARADVAQDAISFHLNYYDTSDYSAIDGSNIFPGTYARLNPSEYRPLFNGNITSMAVHNSALSGAGNVGGPLMLYNYRYDQLNRLTRMDAYTTSNFSSLTSIPQFRERISYDGNGNILTYLRHGHKNSPNTVMDQLTYSYYANSNQLNHVDDAIGPNVYGGATGDIADIDDQSADNYEYDKIGNLIKDSAEGITNIKWSVYGKILEINKAARANNPVTKIVYTYDAQGNRISKTLFKNNGTKSYTWYTRDAQGNVMATYQSSGTSSSSLANMPLNLTERHIYGSSRLGVYSQVVDVDQGPADMSNTNAYKYYRGLKQYELSNHLGNVLATITDKKKGFDGGDGTIDYYKADIVTAQDYYPFGMLMPGRIGYASSTGWTGEPGGDNSGDAILADVAFNEPRENNLPEEYTATNSIEFTNGFISENGDAFLAYISPAEPGGGTGGSGEGSLNNGYYRYGFNGKENDNEVKGVGNQQDYGMRIYDNRLGRFLSTDPITKEYPELTPYQFASNTPIQAVDLDGLEAFMGPFNFVWEIWMEWKYGDPTGTKSLMSGATQKASVETGQMNYQNDNVPTAVQERLDQVNRNQANAQIIKGSAQTTVFMVETSADVTSSIVPVGEGMTLIGKGLKTLLRPSIKAEGFAIKAANRIISTFSKGDLPRAVTAIVDKKTGRVYEGISGSLKNVDQINPRLKQLLPKESLEKWSTTNCAECDALNKAFNDGAEITNLEMHTLKIDKKTGKIADFERCSNCKITTKEVKTTSE